MYKYKKTFLSISTFIYTILTIIEVMVYLYNKSNIFGLIYLLISVFIIFLMVPVAYNYKKHYSFKRISKIILIIAIGFFSSYVLQYVIDVSIKYNDSSLDMISSIFVIKNILKPIIYIFYCVFVLFETKLIKFNNRDFKNRNIDKSSQI